MMKINVRRIMRILLLSAIHKHVTNCLLVGVSARLPVTLVPHQSEPTAGPHKHFNMFQHILNMVFDVWGEGGRGKGGWGSDGGRDGGRGGGGRDGYILYIYGTSQLAFIVISFSVL